MPLNEEQFEQELRKALRREPPPPDFGAKLRRRLPARRYRAIVPWAIAAALLLAALLPTAVLEYNRRREARGREAGRQLMVALRITNAKLRETRARVQRATRHAL